MDAFEELETMFREALDKKEMSEATYLRFAERALDDLSNEPLLIRYQEHIKGGKAVNTKPEHAFGERLHAMFTMALAATGKVEIIGIPNSKPKLMAAGLLALVSNHSIIYQWNDKMERLADSSPLPPHTISKSILPMPVMFWSRETGYTDKEKGVTNNWLAFVHHVSNCYFFGDASYNEKQETKLFIDTFPYGKLWPNDFPQGNYGKDLERILKRCSFLNSPFVMPVRQRLPHHIRRQLERDLAVPRERLQEEVRVIALRRIQHKTPQKPPSGEHRGVEWQHHWWVSHHHRAQWYPSEQAHRVIWIAPYLKGDMTKPLLEKMYAVVR
jgi:hypothetical protein